VKVVLSTIGKFHTFDLARELHARNALEAVFTGYPSFKLRDEKIPKERIRSFPWIHAPYMGFRYRRSLGRRINQHWEYLDKITLDRHVSRRMPPCDVFVGLSGSALRSGRVARSRGAKFVCDRGSSHIRAQDALLREEHARWGMKFEGIDPRVIDLEEAEYAEADCITVPSTFNLKSFTARGIAPGKMRRLAYGVNLERFHPTGIPNPDRFDMLFVGATSLRKGLPYLLEAYAQIRHPKKSLTLVGSPDDPVIALMKKRALWPDDIVVAGPQPQSRLKEIMSRSHVMILPSVEEGLALVQAEAMACGCPVIGTDHTGATDLFEDGIEGFILPIRRADMIAQRLQQLAGDPSRRARMSAACLARVRRIGGWHDYGARAVATYQSLAA
jgi:glycosyltransferase involved in cell wall biosynthesis